MQKLEGRDTYTPQGAPQALGNCDSVVKHDCGVGQVLQNLKTLSNNSDVDQLSDKRDQGLRVPVLNMRGERTEEWISPQLFPRLKLWVSLRWIL